jgi:hypothetical protein
MQQPYDVELSKPAHRSYQQFYAAAQEHLKAGDADHPAVINFLTVENALHNVLPHSPYAPNRTLAGFLSTMLRLSLDTVSITYQVNPGKQTVLVLTICEIDPNRAIRAWLNSAYDRGEIDGLMAQLGISHPCEAVQVSARVIH